jgi:YegS/Rv2252/BmrU family lipid kinase
MTDKPRHKAIFIINPISGVKRKGLDEFRSLLDEHLDKSVFDANILLTEYAGHAIELTEKALEDGIKYFIVVGGDGSINEVGSKLTGTDAVMGIIPAGSGNGLAHHLEIPKKTIAAIEILNKNKVNRIDSCLVNDEFFVSIAGIGFDASVAKKFEESKHRGFISYARIVIREYFTYKPCTYELILDGNELKRSAFFISFANSSQFGYNTRIAPRASIMDGLIDVCIVKKPPLYALPVVAGMVIRRRIDNSKYMKIHRASEVIVKQKKGSTVNVDGEAKEMGKELNICIIPASLNFIVP